VGNALEERKTSSNKARQRDNLIEVLLEPWVSFYNRGGVLYALSNFSALRAAPMLVMMALLIGGSFLLLTMVAVGNVSRLTAAAIYLGETGEVTLRMCSGRWRTPKRALGWAGCRRWQC
jgi:hypothetical protein